MTDRLVVKSAFTGRPYTLPRYGVCCRRSLPVRRRPCPPPCSSLRFSPTSPVRRNVTLRSRHSNFERRSM